MDRRNQSLGEQGEKLADALLRRRGYEILERNYRFRSGEIDIIAKDHGVLCFIEVKLRSSDRQGSSAEAVTLSKQRKLGRMALMYLSRTFKSLDIQCRFDVVAVSFDEDGRSKIDVIKNAFEFAG